VFIIVVFCHFFLAVTRLFFNNTVRLVELVSDGYFVGNSEDEACPLGLVSDAQPARECEEQQLVGYYSVQMWVEQIEWASGPLRVKVVVRLEEWLAIARQRR
jgi:hypothetical protein